MDKDYVMHIARTIRELLVSMTDTAILMSWGIQEFMATVYKDLPGLKFRVNGRLFQGYVLICLNCSDYYEVYLQNEDGTRCISDGVCFDELGEIIDLYIECESIKVSITNDFC